MAQKQWHLYSTSFSRRCGFPSLILSEKHLESWMPILWETSWCLSTLDRLFRWVVDFAQACGVHWDSPHSPSIGICTTGLWGVDHGKTVMGNSNKATMMVNVSWVMRKSWDCFVCIVARSVKKCFSPCAFLIKLPWRKGEWSVSPFGVQHFTTFDSAQQIGSPPSSHHWRGPWTIAEVRQAMRPRRSRGQELRLFWSKANVNCPCRRFCHIWKACFVFMTCFHPAFNFTSQHLSKQKPLYSLSYIYLVTWLANLYTFTWHAVVMFLPYDWVAFAKRVGCWPLFGSCFGSKRLNLLSGVVSSWGGGGDPTVWLIQIKHVTRATCLWTFDTFTKSCSLAQTLKRLLFAPNISTVRTRFGTACRHSLWQQVKKGLPMLQLRCLWLPLWWLDEIICTKQTIQQLLRWKHWVAHVACPVDVGTLTSWGEASQDTRGGALRVFWYSVSIYFQEPN